MTDEERSALTDFLVINSFDADTSISLTVSSVSTEQVEVKCPGSHCAGIYAYDSMLGLVYLCPVCSRTFYFRPGWSSLMTHTPVFYIPEHYR